MNSQYIYFFIFGLVNSINNRLKIRVSGVGNFYPLTLLKGLKLGKKKVKILKIRVEINNI